MRADELLVKNGVIHSVDARSSSHSAMLIRDGIIVALGSDAEVEDRVRRREATETLDLAGRCVVPGFIDAHNHLSFSAFAPAVVNCMTPPSTSVNDVLGAISAYCTTAVPGQWVSGFGFDRTKVRELRTPTRDELDEAAPDNPFFLIDVSGHAGYANSLALAEVRFSQCTPDPWGGSIEKDASGTPTGVLTGTMAGLLNSLSWEDFAERDWSRAIELLEVKMRAYLSVGLTAVGDAGVTRKGAELYRRADAAGKVPLTVHQIHGGDFLFDRADLHQSELLDRIEHPGSHRLRSGAMKIWVDRAYPDGAAIHQVHDGCVKHVGTNFYSERDLRDLALRAADLGIDLVVHAMGNCAIDMTLNTFETIRARVGDSVGLRLEHAFVAESGQADRMAQLGVDLVANPGLAHNVGNDFVGWRGHDQPHLSVLPARTMIDAGVRVSFASDHPAGDFTPVHIMATAMDRMHVSGARIDPEEAVTVAEALRAYTINPATASGRGDSEGSLEPGKRGNFLVVDRDVLECTADELRAATIERTYLDGEALFVR